MRSTTDRLLDAISDRITCMVCGNVHDLSKPNKPDRCIITAISEIEQIVYPNYILDITRSKTRLNIEVGIEEAEIRANTMLGTSPNGRWTTSEEQIVSASTPNYYGLTIPYNLLSLPRHQDFENKLFEFILSNSKIREKIRTCRKYDDLTKPGNNLWFSGFRRLNIKLKELDAIRKFLSSIGVDINSIDIYDIEWDNQEARNVIYSSGKVLKSDFGAAYQLSKASKNEVSNLGWGRIRYTPSSDQKPFIEYLSNEEMSRQYKLPSN